MHINKCVSAAQLRERVEAVLTEGGSDVWCAVPEEAISYHRCRRAAEVETLAESAAERR